MTPSDQSTWNGILDNIELPSTRGLLSGQANYFDSIYCHETNSTTLRVEVNRNWLGMVKSRLPLIESAAALWFQTQVVVILIEEAA